MTQLQLMNPGYYGSDLKSQAMQIAGELRQEGLDASEALEEGWRQAKQGYDEEIEETLELPEGMMSDDEELELIQDKPRKRNPSNPDGAGMTGMVMLAGAGYLFWSWYVSKRVGKPWNFTPWKATIGRRLPSPMGLPLHQPSAMLFSHNSPSLIYRAATPFEENLTLLMP